MAKDLIGQFSKSLKKINWRESYASFILGAIIVVILGLLVANFLTKRGQKIDMGEQTKQEETMTTQEYKVTAGDSLSKIAEKYYGSQEFWPVLALENKIANPNIIYVDSTLNIPTREVAQKIKADKTITSYQVQEGDTLFLIAQRVYGDGSRWTIIGHANKVGKLPNGNPLIFAGSTLTIPR